MKNNKRAKCKRCKKRGYYHVHHVTYSPVRLIPLCFDCHAEITSKNTLEAERLKRSLKNSDRLRLFSVFMKTPTCDGNKQHSDNGKLLFKSFSAQAKLTEEFKAIVS